MIPPLTDRVIEAVAEAEKTKNVKEIADACDVSVQSVYDWRKGKTTKLKGETIVELAEVSGVNARWIINGKGPKFGLTANEKTLLRGYSLMSTDLQESWLMTARAAIERDKSSSKQCA